MSICLPPWDWSPAAWGSSIFNPLFFRAAGRASGLLLCALWLGSACAEQTCLVAFDLGSSGMRAGSSRSARIERTAFNALAALDKPGGVLELEAPTIRGIRTLLTTLDGGACEGLAGGFSAWRRALDLDRPTLIAQLKRIESATGVAVMVIPPAREGRYAYVAAQRELGDRLTTSHVLDIGGGSLQLASASGATGMPFGQKTWYRGLCDALARDPDHCTRVPWSPAELAAARTWGARQLRPLFAALPAGLTMTAVSRPVTRGVKPAIDRLSTATATANTVSISLLGKAIEQRAANPAGFPSPTDDFGRYLLSDMLLLEALMQAVGLQTVEVSEIDLSNVAGLLDDAHAFAWRRFYGCYLDNLAASGLPAFDGNPADCPPGSLADHHGVRSGAASGAKQ